MPFVPTSVQRNFELVIIRLVSLQRLHQELFITFLILNDKPRPSGPIHGIKASI